MSETRLRLTQASFHERPVKLRLPFRFGVVTLTEAPQAFVRVRVRVAKLGALAGVKEVGVEIERSR